MAAKAHVQVTATPRAKGERPVDLRETMGREAASPIVVPPGRVIGVVRAGTAVNRNSDMVDRIRNAVFTISTYKGKGLGTVTIKVLNVDSADWKHEVFDFKRPEGEKTDVHCIMFWPQGKDAEIDLDDVILVGLDAQH